MRRKIKRKKGKINATKIKYDGIQFKSKLELFMYQELKRNNIKTEYEPISYQILESFNFPNESYERQGNSKGDMVDRGGKKILGVRYTPDFVGEDYIIESKGFPNESFALRWKLFKKYLVDNGMDDIMLFKPQKQSECIDVCQIILKRRKERENDD